MTRPVPTLLVLVFAGCQDPSRKPSSPPAHTELIAHESELLKLTLTPQAQQRLDLVIQPAGGGSARQVRQVIGEIVVPSTAAGGVPTNSLTNLAQVGSQQAVADGEVARTEAQACLARIALPRAEALVREEAGSDVGAVVRGAEAMVRPLGPRLMAVPGVANVAVWGQRNRQFQVLIDTDRLRAAGVTLAEVRAAAGEVGVGARRRLRRHA